MNPFSELGLDQEADEREIKRAYAAALRRARPDENPEQFQRLNEAYRAALELRQRRAIARPAQSLPVGEVRAGWSTGPIALDPNPSPASPIAASLTQSVSSAQILDALLDVATTQPAPAFAQWLHQYPPLYSLERKTDVAIALVRVLVKEPAPQLSREALDSIAEFFELGSIGNYPVALQAAFQSLWLASRFDYAQFIAELRRHGRSQIQDFNAWLGSQHALNRPALRRHVSDQLYEWLMGENAPYLEPTNFDVIASYFDLKDYSLLRDRNFVRKAIATENTDFLNVRSPIPIRQLKRRFGPWQAIAIATLPGIASKIVKVAERLRERYQVFPAAVNRKQYDFFAELVYSSPWNQLRWAVIAVRMAISFVAWFVASSLHYKQLALGGSAVVAVAVGLVSVISIFLTTQTSRPHRRFGEGPVHSPDSEG